MVTSPSLLAGGSALLYSGVAVPSTRVLAKAERVSKSLAPACLYFLLSAIEKP